MPEDRETRLAAVEYCCIYCRTGCEEQLATDIRMCWPDAEAISPSKLRYRRINGKPVEEKTPLFPGYIFMRLNNGFPLYRMKQNGLLYKVLRDSDGDWRLSGADRDFAEKIFKSSGLFGFSKAFYEGDRIRILEGPLKELEGKIVRVNHRKQTAQVQLSIQGMDMNVWLGFELIDP